jgi:VWFA-related protein
MEKSMNGNTIWTRLTLILLAALALTPAVTGQGPTTGQQGTTFRATTNFVGTSVVVRDREGRFVPDLTVDEFRVFEDGVLQNITLFTPWVGGRALGNLASVSGATANAPAVEGLILPNVRPKQDQSGRLFIIFIDDLHLQPAETPRVKDLLKKVRDTLVHDNDLVGFVSTGTSSIETDPSYDYGHRRFNEAIEKVMGSAPTADDFIEAALMESGQGPQQVRYNAHVAFRTAYELLDQLAQVTDRRKAFVYISGGYHFNPFSEARLNRLKEYYGVLDQDLTQEERNTNPNDTQDSLQSDAYHKRTAFSTADLVNEVAQLTRAAQRANVAFYTIDPRGLIATGTDASTRAQVSYGDFRDFITTQISTLQVLAEETGGFAGVNSNDFEGIIRRIDSETSDFYQIGYVSSNPDPTKIRRFIKIEITRPNLQEPIYRSEYTIPRQPRR